MSLPRLAFMLFLDNSKYFFTIALMARPSRIEYEGSVYHVTVLAMSAKLVLRQRFIQALVLSNIECILSKKHKSQV